MKRIVMAGLFCLAAASTIFSQIMNSKDVPEEPAKPIEIGGITPFLNVGVQAIVSSGYNFQTGAAGMSYDTSNSNSLLNTMAYFNVIFADSREDVPLMFETGADPNFWSVHFIIKDFTARINTNTSPILELVTPTWMAEVQGHGFHLGLLSQEGQYIYGGSSNNPVITLTGANEVVNLSGTTDASQTDYISSLSPNSVTFSGVSNKSGIVYGGYEQPDLYSAYLSVLAEGDVNTDMTQSASQRAQGWAFAFNGKATPFGLASEKNPLALSLTADAIKGVNFTDNTYGNTMGFGLGAQLDWWLGNNIMVSPVAAFDGRVNDVLTSSHADRFEWETGGGLQFAFSEKKFVPDDWNELSGVTTHFNDKIQKYTYCQLLAMYSKATDLDLAFKFEEPDGPVGVDPNLGAMFEYRVNNVAQLSTTTSPVAWSAIGRLSYDLADHKIVPYVRFYENGANWLSPSTSTTMKLRFGVQASILPNVGAELTYLSPQLYSQGTTAFNAGKLELITIIKLDARDKNKLVMTPKTMNFSDWDN